MQTLFFFTIKKFSVCETYSINMFYIKSPVGETVDEVSYESPLTDFNISELFWISD